MTATIDYEIQVCVDCMLTRETGELESTPDREPWGLLPGADVGAAWDSEDDNPGHFSWNPCDACGSTLGGDRFPYAVFTS